MGKGSRTHRSEIPQPYGDHKSFASPFFFRKSLLYPSHFAGLVTYPWHYIRVACLETGSRRDYPRRPKPHLCHFLFYPHRSFPPLPIIVHLGTECKDDWHNIVPPQISLVDIVGICTPVCHPANRNSAYPKFDTSCNTSSHDFEILGIVEIAGDNLVATLVHLLDDFGMNLNQKSLYAHPRNMAGEVWQRIGREGKVVGWSNQWPGFAEGVRRIPTDIG